MRLFLWLLFVLPIVVCKLSTTVNEKHQHFKAINKCTKMERYTEDHIVPISKIVVQTKKTWCFAIPPLCTYRLYKLVHTNSTVTVNKTRITYDCCKGYKKENNSCVPVCSHGCGHGECIEPEVCLCKEGFRGLNCTQKCERNRYGRGCFENCTCENGAECDSRDGSCYCTDGYIGTHCELTCPEGMYGFRCEEICECQNDGLCDVVDGYCDCQPGYIGDYCEDECDPGTHGQDCEKTCVCLEDTTETCSHVDGKCICKPGYKGEHCESECDNLTYGRNCQYDCNCKNAKYCQPTDGKCLCETGWTGDKCSEKCPVGYFGDDCLDECVPCTNKNATCNHVTGFCDCPAGIYGDSCEKECLEGYWGSNCTKKCICAENCLCISTTGECMCVPLFAGLNISQICPDGRFGKTCSGECNCSNTEKCDAVTGECLKIKMSSNERVAMFSASLIAVVLAFGCIVMGFIVAYVANYYMIPKIRIWWNSFITRDANNNTGRIVAMSFRNPLYRNSEVANKTDTTEKSDSFVNISSTVGEMQSSTCATDNLRPASCEIGPSLNRASEISNISAASAPSKMGQNTTSPTFSSTADAREDCEPQPASDLGIPRSKTGLPEIPKRRDSLVYKDQ